MTELIELVMRIRVAVGMFLMYALVYAPII